MGMLLEMLWGYTINRHGDAISPMRCIVCSRSETTKWREAFPICYTSGVIYIYNIYIIYIYQSWRPLRTCSMHEAFGIGTSWWYLTYNIQYIIYWLVVSTPLKNISQLGWLFPIYAKIKKVPNHQPDSHFEQFFTQRWISQPGQAAQVRKMGSSASCTPKRALAMRAA